MSNTTELATAPITDYRLLFATKPGKKMTFTIKSPTTHFTFKISAVEDNGSRFANKSTDKILFLSVMTGNDNETSYSYVGILSQIQDMTPRIFTTKKSKVSLEAQSVRSLMWIMNKMRFNELPEGYEIMHSGKCCVCGRKLTTPESIMKGIGPVCESSI